MPPHPARAMDMWNITLECGGSIRAGSLLGESPFSPNGRPRSLPNRIMKSSLLMCLLLAGILVRGNAASLGNSFTYQGRLTDAGLPANGEYDLRFVLFDALESGGQASSVLTNENILVTNGVFTTALDFGTNVFTGQ